MCMAGEPTETPLFECERDSACRATIIYAMTDRPVAYEGHAEGHPGKSLKELMIPDVTKRYLLKVWGKE